MILNYLEQEDKSGELSVKSRWVPSCYDQALAWEMTGCAKGLERWTKTGFATGHFHLLLFNV